MEIVHVTGEDDEHSAVRMVRPHGIYYDVEHLVSLLYGCPVDDRYKSKSMMHDPEAHPEPFVRSASYETAG